MVLEVEETCKDEATTLSKSILDLSKQHFWSLSNWMSLSLENSFRRLFDSVTPRFYKKHEWNFFDFHVKLRRHQSYNMIAEYIYIYIYIYNYLTDLEMNNTLELRTEIPQNR